MDINLYFSNDRFVLPFMVGGCLLVVGLATLLPRRVQVPLLALLVGLSAGVQYSNGYAYRSDWEQIRYLFWQMSWRIPGLEPHTTVLLNHNTFTYYTDNSLSAPLNWIYQPEPAGKMDYVLLYPAVRMGEKIPALTADLPVTVDYRSGLFEGSTSQMLALTFQPPGCLRVIDLEIEAENTALQKSLRQIMPFSDPRWILPDPIGRVPETVFGPAPAGTWCEIYEKADLARQMKDWPAIVTGWENAQANGLWPQDAIEQLPFIEAYAHTGHWEEALALSIEAARPGSQYPGMVCRLWTRIEREAPAGPQRDEAVRKARAEFGCE